MSRIKKEHIIDYIKFLYACKYRRSAPQELITRWSQVPNNRIDLELKKLYKHWALTESEIESMESEFLIEVDRKDTPIDLVVMVIFSCVILAILLLLIIVT